METFIAVFASVVFLTFIFVAVRAAAPTFLVPPFHVGLVFRKGKPVEVVGEGQHTFFFSKIQTMVFDPRERWIHVSGQELLTSDGAPIRISVSLLRSVSDVAVAASVSDLDGSVYSVVHLALRDAVDRRELQALVDGRDEVADEILKAIEGDVGRLGLKVEKLKIRDLTLVGETKRAYSDVIQAQLQAKASLERARGEAAAMRSMMNTVKLVRENPELVQLRALQHMEKSGSQKIGLNLTIGGSGAGGGSDDQP